MNTHVTRRGLALPTALIASALFLTGAHAQSTQTLAKATIPFSFEYGQHNFQAGQYTISMVSENIMVVRCGRNSALAVVQRDDVSKEPATGKLVFHRVGDTYALEDVWVPSVQAHLHLPLPKQPKRIEVVKVTPNTAPTAEVAIVEFPR